MSARQKLQQVRWHACAAPRVFRHALQHGQKVGGEHGRRVIQQFVFAD